MTTVNDVITELNGQMSNITTFQIPTFPWLQTAAIIVSVVLGLIYCFFGYKAVRVLSTIIGACIGILVAEIVVGAANLQAPFTILLPIVGAVIFGFLGFFLYRVGVFVVIILAAFSITGLLLGAYTKLDQTVILIVSLVVGVILAVLGVVYLRPVVIIATGLCGGLMISNQIFQNLVMVRWSPLVETVSRIGVGVVLAAFGILYQFKTTKPRSDD